MSKDDGGPAFPATFPPELAKALAANFGGNTNTYHGMSLRDYFAAAALTGMVRASHPLTFQPEWCYGIADAMLRYRR